MSLINIFSRVLCGCWTRIAVLLFNHEGAACNMSRPHNDEENLQPHMHVSPLAINCNVSQKSSPAHDASARKKRKKLQIMAYAQLVQSSLHQASLARSL